MNELDVARAKDIKESFDIIHKNHYDIIKCFKQFYLSKIENLDEDSYFHMKSWLKEYYRTIKNLERFLVNFQEHSHEVEQPDIDNLIKQATSIMLLLQINVFD